MEYLYNGQDYRPKIKYPPYKKIKVFPTEEDEIFNKTVIKFGDLYTIRSMKLDRTIK